MAQRPEKELHRAVRSLDAAIEVALAVGGETRLDRVLDTIVERGRGLIDARVLVILLREGDELAVAATAGELAGDVSSLRFPSGGAAAQLLRGSLRARRPPGRAGSATLVVPLTFRGRGLGVAIALDRLGGPDFDEEDERLL